jgi:hypothetical protein
MDLPSTPAFAIETSRNYCGIDLAFDLQRWHERPFGGTCYWRRFMTKAERISSLAILISFAVIALPAVTTTAHAAGTPEQRRACREDAMKFCRAYVPDVKRITVCMEKNVRKLSPLCRTHLR